eukprot:GHVP01069147.1.p1 GENE.GHVP01069147.1~~GHVP01069147.1.p1  ORF type:complete len:785 (+),score=120.86 GHVP01069147.1:1362-3716(+)
MPDKNESDESPKADDITETVEGFVLSAKTREKIESVDVLKAIKKLKEGAHLLKYCANAFKKPHTRAFTLDMETLSIKWVSPKKSPKETTIPMTIVERIIPGSDSDFFRVKADRQRGIEIISTKRKLHLLCPNMASWQFWLRGLLYAHRKALTKRKFAATVENDFIRKQWNEADIDGSGSVQFSELIQLMQKLNLKADVLYAEMLFLSFDEDGSHCLEYDEFKAFLHKLLTHEDLQHLFDKYKTKAEEVTEKEFRRFLVEIQNTSNAEESINTMRLLDEPFRNKNSLTDLGFNVLMASDFNSIMDPAKRVVYQKMDLPFHNYWIASSHNTYLTGGQLASKSAVGQYIEVLLRNCRCVELDLWDGPKGIPIIYHGKTFTSKLPLQDVLQACYDYAFQNSVYPVILSFEIHCSMRQLSRTGALIKEVLGDSLYILPKSNEDLPGPGKLLSKFLIKAKLPTLNESADEDIAMMEEEVRADLSVHNKGARMYDNVPSILLEPPSTEDDQNEIILSKENNKTDLAIRLPDDSLVSEKEIWEQFYSKVSIKGTKFRTFDGPYGPNCVISLNERSFAKKIRSNAQGITRMNQKSLTRVYPSGTRLLSSNFNPVTVWANGAQMVAMNYQGSGLANVLSMGRFLENGNCGYVLKPSILRDFNRQFIPNKASTDDGPFEPSMNLTVKLLAAQQLPRPTTDTKFTNYSTQPTLSSDILSPYVVMSLFGPSSDVPVTKKSSTVPKNGMNPKWQNESFSFEVEWPSLSLLTFEVRHYDSLRSEPLAYSCVPTHCIRTG